MPQPPRLIDLHTDWIQQYAPETTTYNPALYPKVPARLSQAEGYLQGTWVAVLACYRNSEDWQAQPDPWAALGAQITRIEAEFPGRLLCGPIDVERCLDDPEGLCWGVIGVEGFDFLVRDDQDLARIGPLLDRGVRVFQPTYSASSLLAGSSAAGDDRGVSSLGLAFLQTLVDRVADHGQVRPMIDLAHLNPRAASEVLDWLEADEARIRACLPVYSHGALRHEGFDSPRALTLDNLRRLRALGGVVGFSVGPPFFNSTDQLRTAIEIAASLPYRNRAGYEGIGIGTDFLGVDETLPELANVGQVQAWVQATFDPDVAVALLQRNALRALEIVSGLSEPA